MIKLSSDHMYCASTVIRQLMGSLNHIDRHCKVTAKLAIISCTSENAGIMIFVDGIVHIFG